MHYCNNNNEVCPTVRTQTSDVKLEHMNYKAQA